MENINQCPACGSSKVYRKFIVEINRGYDVGEKSNKYAFCECGAAYLCNRFTDEETQSYYGSGQYREMTGYSITEDEERNRQTARATDIGKHYDEFDIRSHLDIGCSSGILLERVAQTHHGIHSVGVDPDPIWTKDVEKLYKHIDDVPGKFEFITMIHTLEHLSHPREYMAKVMDKLEQGGLLHIEVPNRRANIAAFAAPSHVVAYDTASLTRLLKHIGFVVLGTILHGGYEAMPLDICLTALATNDEKLSRSKFIRDAVNDR